MQLHKTVQEPQQQLVNKAKQYVCVCAPYRKDVSSRNRPQQTIRVQRRTVRTALPTYTVRSLPPPTEPRRAKNNREQQYAIPARRVAARTRKPEQKDGAELFFFALPHRMRQKKEREKVAPRRSTATGNTSAFPRFSPPPLRYPAT